MTTATVTELIRELKVAGQTLACCESLSSGLAAAAITSVPGASAVFRGGLVTYATDLKATLAGVDPEVLRKVGPVAAETAEQMAAGARKVCGADWAFSLTGVAGPDPQNGHPVGEVFLGIAGPEGLLRSHRITPEGQTHLVPGAVDSQPIRVLNGDRAEIRTRSVEYALQKVLGILLEQKAGKGR